MQGRAASGMAVLLVALALMGSASAFLAPARLPVASRSSFTSVAATSPRALRLAPRVGRFPCLPSFGLKMVDIQPRVEEDIETADFFDKSEEEQEAIVHAAADIEDSGETATVPVEEVDPTDVSNFRISEQSVDNLAARGISKLFPVQSSTYNEIFDGRDVLARARTGTGKTMGFALPIIERLMNDKRDRGETRRVRGSRAQAIILSPTRELAMQVEREIEALTSGGAIKIQTLAVYGGVPYSRQERALKDGVDVVVGTPGRMIDLMKQGALDLSDIKFLVLDEADEMLNRGFADDVETLMGGMPKGADRPQTLLFSATVPPWVKDLARTNLNNPHDVDLVGNSRQKVAEGVTHVAVTATARQRSTMLADLITLYRTQHAIVFVNTKRDADELVSQLGMIIKGTEALHGDIPQGVSCPPPIPHIRSILQKSGPSLQPQLQISCFFSVTRAG